MKDISKKFIVGIDIGGSKVNVVLFRGIKVLHKDKQPTETKSLAAFINQLEGMISSVISPLRRREFIGIGCGIAGALDLEKGQVLRSPNLPIINDLKIQELLSKKFHREVFIDNDARSFLRGEYFWGAGRGYKNLVGVTLGSGIGGGIMIDGKMLYGNSGSAGEVGHMTVCGGRDFEKKIIGILKYSGHSSIFKVFEAARKGDKKARGAFVKFGEQLGFGLANIVNILDPEIIIIGGGIAGASKFFLKDAEKTMKKSITSPKAAQGVKILLSKLGEDAGAMGAAALLLQS